MAGPAGRMTLDPTWQVGIGWGLILIVLTIGGVYFALRYQTTAALGLGVLGWLGFMAWLEKGVTK